MNRTGYVYSTSGVICEYGNCGKLWQFFNGACSGVQNGPSEALAWRAAPSCNSRRVQTRITLAPNVFFLLRQLGASNPTRRRRMALVTRCER